jgi:hypothetical protein
MDPSDTPMAAGFFVSQITFAEFIREISRILPIDIDPRLEQTANRPQTDQAQIAYRRMIIGQNLDRGIDTLWTWLVAVLRPR